GTPPPPYTVG
nr:Chain P, WW Domain Binding Protein-1 [synthetic construct]1K5R_B Chain B, Fragment of WBP-1 [synthetic construct]